MIRNMLLWVGVVVGLLGAKNADAATVYLTFCASYQVDYDDSDLPGTYDEDLEGDYFYSNSDKTARGARIAVVGPTSATQLFADWDGFTAGCAGPFEMDTTESYDVQIHSVASIRGNIIDVMNDQDARKRWVSVALDDWSPTVTGQVNVVTANTHKAWHVAAAAGHAMWRRGGGLSNKTFDFFTDYDTCGAGETSPDTCDPCGNGSGSCHRSGDVHMSSGGTDNRFIIVHEMGHALEYFKRGSSSAPRNYDANEGGCVTITDPNDPPRHQMQTKEWQSAAIAEGWAQFYAAVAFNNTTETNCGFVYYKQQDYDLDTVIEGDGVHAISCEDGPNNLFGDPSPPVVDDLDYLGDWCTGTLDDKATELDWLRFWWDFLSEEPVSFDDCLDILNSATLGGYAVPPLGNWDPAPDHATADEDRPYVRMEESADAWDLLDEWLDHVDNGIDR